MGIPYSYTSYGRGLTGVAYPLARAMRGPKGGGKQNRLLRLFYILTYPHHVQSLIRGAVSLMTHGYAHRQTHQRETGRTGKDYTLARPTVVV